MQTSPEDGVSAAIAGVLLIALVLIGSGIVAAFVLGQPFPEKIPKVQFGIKQVDETTLVLVHEGGDSLQSGSFNVVVDGTHIGPTGYSIRRPGGFTDLTWWNLSSYVVIPLSSPKTVRSVALTYAGGTGETVIRSSSSPLGYFIFPSYDPNEKVEIPVPIPTHVDPGGDIPIPDWPTTEDPQPTFTPVNSKQIYVAAEDSNPSEVLSLIGAGNRVFVCNGDADEQEINDALSLGQGGIVHLLAGNFQVSGRLVLQTHTTLQGAGSGLTILKIRGSGRGPSDAGAYLPVTVNQEYVNLVGFRIEGHGFVMITRSHVRVRDVWATSVLDGERYQAAGNGMFFIWATAAAPGNRVDDIEFWRCIASDCNTHGWNLNQDYSDGVTRNITNVRLVNCLARLCGHGEAQGSRSPWITGYDLHEWQDLQNLEVRGCIASDNWESGFHLEPGARYGSNGESIGPRTISRNISFVNCVSERNGQRNTDPGRFFMSGYYLSRDTTMTGCTSKDNANAGFYVHAGEDVAFSDCHDDGSFYGWKICKNSKDIALTDCTSRNNDRWGLWLSFSNRIIITRFHQYSVPGHLGYQNILGWYKDEPKYQLPVSNSYLEITAHPAGGLPIINQAGSGNVYHLHEATP